MIPRSGCKFYTFGFNILLSFFYCHNEAKDVAKAKAVIFPLLPAV